MKIPAKIAFTLAWRGFRSDRKRSLTASLGIGLGIATVLSVQIVDHNTILTERIRRGASPSTDRSVHIRPVRPTLPIGGAFPDELIGHPDLAEFHGLFFARLELSRESEDPTVVSVLGVGPSTDPDLHTGPPVKTGRRLAQPGEPEVLVSRRLFEDLDLGLGEIVELRRTTTARAGCIKGELVDLPVPSEEPEARSFEIVGVFNDTRPRIVVPFEAGATLFRSVPFHPIYVARLTGGAVHQDIREGLKGSFLVEKPRAALIGERIDQRAFRKALRILSGLALLLGLFVIYNTFSFTLTERIREIGLLRAIGVTHREILFAILIEGTILALAGTALGLALTSGIVGFMAKLNITTLGYGKPLVIHQVPWGSVVGIASLGSLAALIGMVVPLLRARGISIISSIRGGHRGTDSNLSRIAKWSLLLVPALLPVFYLTVTPPLGQRQAPVLGLVIAMALILAGFLFFLSIAPGPVHWLVGWTLGPIRRLLPIETSLAQAAIRGSKPRVMATLAGLTIVVATVFTVRSVNQSFLSEMERFCARATDGRAFVRFRKNVSFEALEAVCADIPQISRAYFLDAEVHSPFPLRAIRTAEGKASIADLADDPELARRFARGEILVLSRFLARSFGYDVGDVVTLPTFAGPVAIPVGAISDTLGYFPDDRSFALLESSRMNDLYCMEDLAGRSAVFEIDEGADRERIRGDLHRSLSEHRSQWIQTDRDLARSYLRDRRQDFYVFDVLLLLIALLSCVGQLNSLLIALLERKRELGLLRTLGMTQPRVRILVLLESGTIGLWGGLFGGVLSMSIAPLSIAAVREISRLELTPTFNLMTFLAPPLAGISIGLFAGLVPAARSTQLDLSALSRHE